MLWKNDSIQLVVVVVALGEEDTEVFISDRDLWSAASMEILHTKEDNGRIFLSPLISLFLVENSHLRYYSPNPSGNDSAYIRCAKMNILKEKLK